MLISKHHLLTRHTASADQSRPLLTAIEIFKQGEEVVAVATDGYILSEVRETVPSDEGFPGDASGVDKVRLTAKSAAKMSSALKPNKLLPVLGYANATSDGIVVTDLEHMVTFNDAEIEGNYPDYAKLIPDSKAATATVRVNPEYLMKALKPFKGEHSVELETHGELKPVVIRSSSAGRTILGVVMPVRA